MDVNRGGDDSLGVLLCDSLNIHATLRRGDNDGALGCAVHKNSEVELSAGELALDNEDGVAETASGSGLLGDQLVTNHLVCENGGFAGTAWKCQMESALLAMEVAAYE